MSGNLETLGTLERRLSMTVPAEEVERKVSERLKQIARTAKMPGFRPGKVPMRVLEQQYRPQVHSEVLGEAVEKAFGDAVKEANVRVAGYPRIEKKEGSAPTALEFSATFEVYPEFAIGDVASKGIERPTLAVDDAAVDRTIEILRKQRTTFHEAGREAREGDRVTVDFEGKIDGQPFQGNKAEGFAFVLGEGRMLPEFEQAAKGLSAGQSKTFPLRFPDDYHGKEVAGKTASFDIKVSKVEEPKLPEVDEAFAKSLGVTDGDVAKMRTEIRGNVEREVRKRVDARVKSQALEALRESTALEIPKALVGMEAQRLLEAATADLRARGLKPENLPIDPTAFEETAKRRVALGLIMAELARKENLQPKPAEVRALIEQESQSYENPAEVVKWFYMQPQRLSEMEGLALEGNVVNWVLSKAKVTDKAVTFDELMGSAA